MSDEPARSDFAQELDRVLNRSETSLGWLADYLRLVGSPVSAATLSYWRTGHSAPRRASTDSVANIEKALGLEYGHLLDLLDLDGGPSAAHPRLLPQSGRHRGHEATGPQAVR